MQLKNKTGLAWLLAFVGVFAALAAFVFWGTWSMDVAPVMPDDPYRWSSSSAEAWSNFWKGFLSSGKVIPTDVFWSGLIISPYFCQELKYVSGVFLSALGLIYFLRGRGLSHLASYGAGLLLAFCGYWLTLFSAGHAGWFAMVSYIVFEFGFADRAVRQGALRHWLLLGLFEAWASCNQQDLWLLFSVFVAAYVAWCCVRERTFPWKGLLISAVVFALVGLPNFRATLNGALKGRQEQMAKGENITQKDASEADKRWEFVTNWSMPTEDTLEFVNARVHGDTSCPFVLSINGPKGVKPYVGALGRPLNAKQGNYRQHSLYVGWVTCLLAVVGGLMGLRGLRRLKGLRGGEDRAVGCSVFSQKSDVLFFLVAGLVFYAFSLGRYFEPAYRVIFSLPFGDLIRCPVKWHHLTELCLAVLAGYGLETLLGRLGQLGRLGRFAPWIVGAVVLVGAIDLAGEAKRFCAPVNYGSARRTNSTMQLTILPRQQFQDPQVAAMVRAGRIVSQANYMGNPNYFVVGVLTPYQSGKATPDATNLALGVLSLLTVCGVLALVRRRGEFRV